jgi:MoxR-like ATPase
MKHLLIVGRPGSGKTTLLKDLTRVLRHRPIDGFLTEELREGDVVLLKASRGIGLERAIDVVRRGFSPDGKEEN